MRLIQINAWHVSDSDCHETSGLIHPASPQFVFLPLLLPLRADFGTSSVTDVLCVSDAVIETHVEVRRSYERPP